MPLKPYAVVDTTPLEVRDETLLPAPGCEEEEDFTRNGKAELMPTIQLPHWRTRSRVRRLRTNNETWAVTVERNGEQVVTIASTCLSGRDLSAEDERVIRDAAQHLVSFVGRVAEPAIACPACGVSVRQVSSATLDLALWQHWNWTCSARTSGKERTELAQEADAVREDGGGFPS